MDTTQKFGALPIAVTSATPGNPKQHLVFLHMSWGGAWVFKLYMKFFVSKGYACHAVDLRGHGKSGGSVGGATMQNYVEDVHIAVSGLGLEAPIVVGHSMGGLVALMYASQFPTAGVVAIDASSPLEVQKTSEEKTYPVEYKPEDAGMPNPMKAMVAFSDIPLMQLMAMKFKLGVESGVARSDRKRGVSVPKEALTTPLLFIGAENGTSVPFGIGIEQARAQALYYGAPVVEVKDASHPGLLIGKNWHSAAGAILSWMEQQ